VRYRVVSILPPPATQDPNAGSGLVAGGQVKRRIGTKALVYWPQRFVSDDDADDLLELFDEVEAAGRHLAVMGHYSHPVELDPAISHEAVRRVRNTGVQIRMQGPLIRHVNDDSEAWATLW